MSWIDKILPSGVRSEGGEKRSSVPEGLWKKCVKCEAVLYRPDVERNDDVCPKCRDKIKVLGADYKMLKNYYTCNDCNEKFQEIATKFLCLKCNNQFKMEDAKWATSLGYRVVPQ